MDNISQIILPDGNTYNITASISVIDITNSVTITKTSGPWSIAEYRVYRYGDVVDFYIAVNGNGSNISSNTNGFVGTISGVLPLQETVILYGFYTAAPVTCTITSSGSVAIGTRNSATVLSASSLARMSGTFIRAGSNVITQLPDIEISDPAMGT